MVAEDLSEARLEEKDNHNHSDQQHHLAEQEQLIRRRVALKIIRPGLAFFPRSRERFQREVEALTRCAPQEIEALYLAPLERLARDPDVVVVYGNPAQLMRLIHGGTHRSGNPIQSSFSGRASSCTEGVIGAYQDQTLKVVVPGNGDRVWGGCQDHEMVMAVPAAGLAEVVEGLEKTHAQGIRYPIPTYMRYSPEVALSLPLSDIFQEVDLSGIGKKK